MLLLSPCAVAQSAGEQLPPWSKGGLDIHQIHTGRGNAALFVFPDGTTMLLDAGGVPDRGGLEIGPARPNPSKSPAGWIAQYVARFGARNPASIDSVVVTHYHDDHMAALPEVARLLPVNELIDRGLDPAPPALPVAAEYARFRSSFTGRLRRADAGDVILRASDVQIRCVASNGRVWTGSGNDSAPRIPDGARPNENELSLALLVEYGKFRYFTGGDIPGIALDEVPEWHDLETPVARAVGRVHVAVLNHHGWLDSTNSFFLRTLRPEVVVIPAWHASHPDHGVVRRLRSPAWGTHAPDLFITSLLEAPKAILRYLGEATFKSTEGHIVVRVEPGGTAFRVFVLDDTVESWPVKAVFGPYPSSF